MALKRIYLDSNIFIAYIKAEIGGGFKPMGSDAEWLFKRTKGKAVFVLSSIFFKEVKKHSFYYEQEVVKVFDSFGLAVEIVAPSETELKLEFEFTKRGIHSPDSLHAALAVANACDCIVTFNKKDFSEKVIGINVFEPAELLL